MSNKLRVCDINGLLERAEREIGYSAKCAINQYYPLWQNGYRMGFAEFFRVNCYLRPWQIPSCQKLMDEFGMTDDAKFEESEDIQIGEKPDRFKYFLKGEKKFNNEVDEILDFSN